MNGELRTVASLRGELSKFSEIISMRFKKPKKRLIKEMVYRGFRHRKMSS